MQGRIVRVKGKAKIEISNNIYEENYYRCYICDESFDTLSRLINHFKKIHGEGE